MIKSPVTIIDVGYRSTHVWVLSAGRSRLVVDLGWIGRFGALRANLRQMGVPLEEVRHGLATHYHIDHAGCAQELKNAGMTLIVTPEQVDWIPRMKRWAKPEDGYLEIRADDNLILRCEDSRAFLAGLGFAGQIVHTPGHSDDSVSLLLDTGEAFTGDLNPGGLVGEEDAAVVADSWNRLRELGARVVYGGHGAVRGLVPL